jgi:hypothetical protein
LHIINLTIKIINHEKPQAYVRLYLKISNQGGNGHLRISTYAAAILKSIYLIVVISSRVWSLVLQEKQV